MVTWDTVRELALALPEVEEGTAYRQPAFRVGAKVFASMSPHVDGAFVLRADRDERPLMIEAAPDVYFVTPHYENYDMVLVRLEAIDRDELQGRLEDAWLRRAPPRLAKLRHRHRG